MKKIYLSGAIQNVAKDISTTWRDYCETMLEDVYEKEVFNPLSHYNTTNKTPNNNRECRKLYEHYIKECDIILVNLDFSNISCGTNYELGYASSLDKPIIGFGTSNIYGWAEDVCDVVFDSMDKAIEYIVNHY